MERLVLIPGDPRPEGVPTRIRCQFNPEELVQMREAGLAQRPAALSGIARVGAEAGRPQADLRFTGQGRDTLTLRLLFEVEGAGQPGRDVRALTEPLFRLAAPVPGRGEAPCPIDLFWGRTWSFHGAISRIAERVDRFTANGVATRSWISLEVEALPRQTARSGLMAFPASGAAS